MKIIYSPRFEREAIQVYWHISKDKPKAGREFLAKVKEHIRTLIDHPHKGRPTEDISRELIY